MEDVLEVYSRPRTRCVRMCVWMSNPLNFIRMRDRNHRQKGIDWQFTVGDARLKLKHLYPVINIKN